ncbi:TrbC family F-type conjugative pilus assembly protein [Thiomicrospira sp.]|uniref:TrbC family F-type conjugative pilus assembly protein n=1 Tax=Thiomicrospira sp. TaxID=935 RepID=UPI002F925129
MVGLKTPLIFTITLSLSSMLYADSAIDPGEVFHNASKHESLKQYRSMLEEQQTFKREDYAHFFEKSMPSASMNPEINAWVEKFANEANTPSLYILISTSMPEGLIRSYSLDSLVYGIPMVYRGVKENDTLGKFMNEHILKYHSQHGAPNFMIDPRLFTLWNVRSVPAIVYTKKPPTCDQMIDAGGYQECNKADPESYWKIEGTVDVAWALSEFKKAGAPISESFLNLKSSSLSAELTKDDYEKLMKSLSPKD